MCYTKQKTRQNGLASFIVQSPVLDIPGTIASAQPVIPNSPASDENQSTILYKEGELGDIAGFYTKHQQQHVITQ